MSKFPTRLYAMLTYRRPHLSATEEQWIGRYLLPHKPSVLGKPGEGALCITVPLADGTQPTTLFSCHTDTMHRGAGMQSPRLDKDGWLSVTEDCLGADDGAGAYIMLEMIDAKVPGVYLFHRGEERGGIGSRNLAFDMKDWLGTFKRAVAFDRRGVTDVITHQRGGRCCSDTFGTALAEALNVADESFVYDISDGGSFTDTANYTDLIPECTNVSCGYEREHGPQERLFVPHVIALAEACKKVDWESLPTERVAGTREPRKFPSYPVSTPQYGGRQSSLWDDGYRSDAFYARLYSDDIDDRDPVPAPSRRTPGRQRSIADWPDTVAELQDMTEDDMIAFAYDDPESFVYLVRAALGMEDADEDEDGDDLDPGGEEAAAADAVPVEPERLPHGMM